MYSINDISKGTFIQYEGQPYQVLATEHVKMGRGGAVLRTKLRNLINSSVLDVTFRSGARVESAEVTKLPAQYLYKEGGEYKFMDGSTFEQYALAAPLIAEARKFLKEGEEVTVMFFKDKPVGIEIPIKVVLKVVHSGPGARGDTTTAALKDVVLETGHELKAPLFINEGDSIRVDTRTGKYIERV